MKTSEPPPTETWKLDTLADASGVSPRTIRYYVQRGLLPPPVFRARDTSYGPEHLLRLQAIRQLQGRHWPLEAIEAELERRASDGTLAALAEGTDVPELPGAEPEPATWAEPGPLPMVTTETRWRRLTLADGVELHVAEPAGPEARQVVEAVLAAVRRQ